MMGTLGAITVNFTRSGAIVRVRIVNDHSSSKTFHKVS